MESKEHSEIKHSKGPWKLFDEGNLIMILSKNEKYVCDVQIHQTPREMGLHEESERLANAKLIVTAPLLLEALIKISDAALGGENVQEKIYKLAVDAIKKATL